MRTMKREDWKGEIRGKVLKKYKLGKYFKDHRGKVNPNGGSEETRRESRNRSLQNKDHLLLKKSMPEKKGSNLGPRGPESGNENYTECSSADGGDGGGGGGGECF